MSTWRVELHRPYGVLAEAADTRCHGTALRVMNGFIRRCQGRVDGFVAVTRDGREVSYAAMRGDSYQGPRGVYRAAVKNPARRTKAQLDQANVGIEPRR